ncbi:hypothetical protein ACFL1B_02945 [Nanoarchaeota archaeon]
METFKITARLPGIEVERKQFDYDLKNQEGKVYHVTILREIKKVASVKRDIQKLV